jgi:hypothetical protein
VFSGVVKASVVHCVPSRVHTSPAIEYAFWTQFIQGLAGLTMLTYVLQVQVARGSNLIPKRS